MFETETRFTMQNSAFLAVCLVVAGFFSPAIPGTQGELLMYCPPTEEGQSFTANCSAQPLFENERDMQWHLYFPFHWPKNFTSYCFASSSECTSSLGKVDGTASYKLQDKTRLASALSISKTLYPNHTEGVLTCIFKNISNSQSTKRHAKSCKVQLYSSPRNTSCSVESHNSKIVVRCNTAYIYPELNCDIQQVKYTNETEEAEPIAKEHIRHKNHEKTKDSRIFYEADCWAEFYVSSPGKYTYNVTMYPKLDDRSSDNFNYVQISTNPVVIETAAYSVEVSIPGDIVLCANETEKDVRLVCSVTGLKNRPSFVWTVGDIEYSGSSGENKETGSRRHGTRTSRYTSYLDLTVTKSYHGMTVNCRVRPGLNYQELTESLRLDVLWMPHQPPAFQTLDGRDVGDVLSPFIYRRKLRLQCAHNETGTRFLAFEVKCRTIDQRTGNATTRKILDPSVGFHSFNFSVRMWYFLDTECTCSVKVSQRTPCNDSILLLQSRLRITPVATSKTQMMKGNQGNEDVKVSIIVGALVVLFIFGFTIVIYKLCALRASAYGTGTEKATCDEDILVKPYAITNVADQSASMVGDIQQQSAVQSDKQNDSDGYCIFLSTPPHRNYVSDIGDITDQNYQPISEASTHDFSLGMAEFPYADDYSGSEDRWVPQNGVPANWSPLSSRDNVYEDYRSSHSGSSHTNSSVPASSEEYSECEEDPMISDSGLEQRDNFSMKLSSNSIVGSEQVD